MEGGSLGSTTPRRRRGSFSPVFRSNRIVLHSNDGLVSKERDQKRIKKENKEFVHAQGKWRGEEMGNAQVKWRGGPSGAPLPGAAGARSRPFSGRIASFCLQTMVLYLRKGIKKESKKEIKNSWTHRENGGGWLSSTRQGFILAHFLVELAHITFKR